MKARIRQIANVFFWVLFLLWNAWQFRDRPTALAISIILWLGAFGFTATNSPENFKRFFWVNTISAAMLVVTMAAILISVLFF